MLYFRSLVLKISSTSISVLIGVVVFCGFCYARSSAEILRELKGQKSSEEQKTPSDAPIRDDEESDSIEKDSQSLEKFRPRHLSIGAGYSEMPVSTSGFTDGRGVGADLFYTSEADYLSFRVNSNPFNSEYRQYIQGTGGLRLSARLLDSQSSRSHSFSLDGGLIGNGLLTPDSSASGTTSDPFLRASGDAQIFVSPLTRWHFTRDDGKPIIFGFGPEVGAGVGATYQVITPDRRATKAERGNDPFYNYGAVTQSTNTADFSSLIVGPSVGGIGYALIPIGPSTFRVVCHLNNMFGINPGQGSVKNSDGYWGGSRGVAGKLTAMCNAAVRFSDNVPVEVGYDFKYERYDLSGNDRVMDGGPSVMKLVPVHDNADLFQQGVTVRIPFDIGEKLNRTTK